MSYLKYMPCDDLKPYVDFYYIWSRDDYIISPLTVSGQASCNCVLVFNFGDQYKLINPRCNGMFLPRSFLSGYSVSPFKLQFQGKLDMLGVAFRGTKFRHMFHLPHLYELNDTRLDFEFIAGTESRELNEKLEAASGNRDRIQIIESYLLTKLEASSELIDRKDIAVDKIFENRGMIRMDDLANQICLSPRQLRRSIISELGIGPKFLARLKRFNYVNMVYSGNPELSCFDFIVKGAYYDQSHFIKDYAEFTGLTPHAFIQHMQETRSVTNQEYSTEKEYMHI